MMTTGFTPLYPSAPGLCPSEERMEIPFGSSQRNTCACSADENAINKTAVAMVFTVSPWCDLTLALSGTQQAPRSGILRLRVRDDNLLAVISRTAAMRANKQVRPFRRSRALDKSIGSLAR